VAACAREWHVAFFLLGFAAFSFLITGISAIEDHLIRVEEVLSALLAQAQKGTRSKDEERF